MLKEARRLLRKGFVVRAKKLLERARTLPPQGRLLLAESYYRLRLNSRARVQARRALPDARARLLLGSLALDDADYAAAEEEFCAARDSARPKRQKARALSGLAACAASQRLLARAGKFAREAMSIAPKDAIVLRDVSFLKDEEGKRSQALKYARLAGPTLAGCMARARILAEEGKLKESLAELMRAKRRAPEEVDVFLALAEVFEAKNEFLAAADALSDSIALSPRGSHAHAARAVEVRLRLLSGDVAGARRALRKVRGPERTRLARAAGSRRKSAFIRGFPALRQLWDYCGPAVLAMLLEHWGLPGRQLEIGFDVWDGGTPLYVMKSYSRRRGLFARSFRGDLRKLKRLVELGVPCVLDVVRDGERHYLVAVGYDGRLGEVIFRDPSELGLVWMRERELRAAWDPGGNWTLAVVPRRMRTSVADAGVEPDEGVERAEKACSLFDRGKYKQALVEARGACRRGGGLLAARLVYMCLAVGGRWRDAQKEAARLREEFPGLDWTLAAEGEALWAMGELARAAKLLRKTRSPAGRLSRAGVLFQMGRNAQAAREVEEVLRLEPDSAPAHALLGRVHLKRGENGKAFDEYGKAVELCPGDARIVAELGYALEKRNEFAKAERTLRRAARLDARDPWVLNQLAYFLAEHGRSLPEAVRLARKALRLERDNRSYVHDTLGWALLKRGRLKEGLKWLRLAEKGDDGTDPEGSAEVLYHVAVGLKRAGKAAQAEAKLRKAARLKGEYARRAREELS